MERCVELAGGCRVTRKGVAGAMSCTIFKDDLGGSGRLNGGLGCQLWSATSRSRDQGDGQLGMFFLSFAGGAGAGGADPCRQGRCLT